jgi:beta-lactamase superfamily II metal-dependent hydrolase
VAVIDAPVGSAVIDTLEELGVTHVEHALISHSDADHLEGILALLTSKRITVRSLHLNPDAEKTSTAWRDLLAAVRVASLGGTFRTYTSLTVSTPGAVSVGDIKMTVVSPSEALALSAVGGRSPDDKANSANTLSAVIKVERAPDVGVLLAGDLDATGLQDVVASGANLTASVLVYPHHGGLPGSGNPDTFVQGLLDLVRPSQVYVSNGRNKHGNPRPEVVEAILDRGCGLACTQLAKACGDPVPNPPLERWPSAGREMHHSCAGTISLTLEAGGAVREPAIEAAFHAFVANHVPTAMCARTKN